MGNSHFVKGFMRGEASRFPLVSVIIPVWNRAAWIAEAVESVLAQTCADFELLAVDDGSTDETAAVLRRFPEVRILRLAETGGVSRARNFGFRRARGELICFLDSDDLWHKDKLAAQVEAMRQRPECPVSYTDEIWIRNGVRVNPMNKHRKYSGDIFRHCLPLCIVSPSSVMMRRELFAAAGGFDESLPACEDYDLWLRIAARHPFHFIDEKLIVKRGGHSSQLSRRYWGMDRFRVQALEKLLASEALRGDNLRLTTEVLVEKCAILASGFEKRGNGIEAAYYRNLGARYSSVCV